MSTEAPADLKAFRTEVLAETGLTDPVEVGITGDPAHAARGGYHISGDDIHDAGTFNTDYSTKRSQDHFLPNPNASAVDVGDNWPRGGRAAWLRFNNNVSWELIHTGEMPSVRAMNFSTNGEDRKRYDRANAGDGVINSTDTVTVHTHIEFWRNTAGTLQRAADLQRLLAHIRAARDNTSISAQLGGVGMAEFTQPQIDNIWYTLVNNPGGAVHARLGALATDVAAVKAAVAELAGRPLVPIDVNALAAAIVAGLPGVDQAQVLAALQSPEGQAALTQAANTAEDS